MNNVYLVFEESGEFIAMFTSHSDADLFCSELSDIIIWSVNSYEAKEEKR